MVETWQHPGAREAELTPLDIDAIKAAVKQSEWRESAQAEMWVGKAIAPVLRLDPKDDNSRIKTIIKKLIADGVLKTIPGRSETRKSCLYVVGGDWSAPLVELAQPKEPPTKEVPMFTAFAPPYEVAHLKWRGGACATAPLAPPTIGWPSGAAQRGAGHEDIGQLRTRSP